MNAAATAPLSTRIRSGERVFGLLIKMPSPAMVEIAGHLGFDMVVIDQEHGLGDTSGLEEHLRAADSAGIDALVRVGSNNPIEILRVLDAGARGVIIPHISSAAAAEKAVRAAHYPPVGIRGVATSTRAGRFSTSTLHDHLERARRETIVIVQVEDDGAVAEVDKIAATPGVDAVFLGPTDLSVSLGHPGDMEAPTVADAVDRVVGEVVMSHDAALCVVVESGTAAAPWVERGASVVLFMATALLVDILGRTLEDAKAIGGRTSE